MKKMSPSDELMTTCARTVRKGLRKQTRLSAIFPLRFLFTQFVFFSLFSVTVHAGSVKSQQSILDKVISISVSKEEIKNVLAIIQKQTSIGFIYSPSAIDLQQQITFSGQHVTVETFLKKALMPLNIGYKVVEDKILLYTASMGKDALSSLMAGDRIIRGKVLGADNLPLQGASVKISGTSIGTQTDANGNFSLNAPSGEVVLEISYIGYVTQTISVSSNAPLTVVLVSAVTTNQEVVVTALGISKSARKVGYATSKVGGELLSKAKEANVAYSLEGRVPGLNISGASGGPGASASILIRGISNFTSSTGPLFVIDGVPMDNTQKGAPGVYGGSDQGDGISSINPDDIEDIVVLKGSTASALYGVRAANGVIQITTKSGKGQKGFGVEVNSNFTLAGIINNRDFQKVYGHGINGVRPKTLADLTNANLSSWGEKLDGAPSVAQDGQMHPYKAVKDPLGKFYRVAPVVTNTVSFTSSGENGNMRFSVSHMDNQSVIPESGLRRYTANLNISQNVLSKLRLTLMANYIDEKVTQRPFLNDMSRNPNWTMTLLPANISPDYLKPGYNTITGYENAMSSDGYMPNPWFIVNKTINNTYRRRLISSTALRYDIIKGLYVQARTGMDLINDDALNIEPTGIGFNRLGSLQAQTKAQTFELNMDAMAGYSHKLFGNIDLDATIGGNIRKFSTETEGTSGSQWKQPFLYTASNLVNTTPIYKYQQLRTNSAYYTLDFSYKSFLTIGTTGRYDVFSTLPAGNRSIFTPSVSGSFVFSDLLHLPSLTYGKLRVSYAQTSGEATPYQTSVYYQVQPLTNSGLPYGNILDQVANINLSPYRLKEFEIGMELKGWNNRVGLDITYFHRRTVGELISKQISIASGYNYSYEKLGSTQNSGIELMLTGTPVKSDAFTWNVSFNLTKINNKLVSLDGTANPAPLQTGQYRPSVGPFNNGAFVAAVQGLPLSQIMAYDYKYDAKGNIVIGDNGIPVRGDLKAMGSGLPKYYGGLNNDFTWKQFNLSFLIDYKFGNKVLSATDFFSMYYGLNKATLAGRETGIVVKGVTSEGAKNAQVISAQDYYRGLVTNISTISVYDGSFIKFRQITIGYMLKAALLRKTPFQSVNVSLVGRNLLTLMKHTPNTDPEDMFSPLAGYAGLEGLGIPQTRTYGINLNFKFKK